MIPERVRIVIIGGGIHGASLLYHLAAEGETDVLLVEKAEPTSGSTWHAAGQITRSVGDYTTAVFHDYALDIYSRIEAETGQAVSLHTPGGLRVAYTDHEMDALRSQLGVGRYVGYPIELIGPDEIAQYSPHYDTTDVLGAIWTEGEGHVDPSGATMAFLAGARAAGAVVSRHNRVLSIEQTTTGTWNVHTEKGSIEAEHVVDCAGCYADQVGQLAGFRVTQANVTHHYLVTEPVAEFEASDVEMPVMRDNRVAGYIRQEQTAALIGIYEHHGAQSVWDDGVPWEAENPLFDADYDRIAPWLAEAFNRMPILADRGIKRVVHGAITHTTDGHMLLGPAPGVRNFWLNTGSSIGLAWGPGAGRELARWIVHGETELNLRRLDPRRFGWMTPEYTRAKAIEDYEWMFKAPVPDEERPSQRPVRTSPLYERLVQRRAMHGQAYGWEQPKWFVPDDMALADLFGHRRVGWFDPVAAECRAVRERVGLLDLTAFAKYEIFGADSEAFLRRVGGGRVPAIDGRISLGYVLTDTGRIETEVTISRLGEGRYYVISGPMGEQRDIDWFRHHVSPGEDVTITDLSTKVGVLVVAGPNARELVSRCSDDDWSNEAFPWLRLQDRTIAGVELRALRVGFSGARGWELHVPILDGVPADEQPMLAAYDALWAAGKDLGVANFGSHALNSLRLEKRYLTRHELTHDIGPGQAGVSGFLRKDRGFIGADRLDDEPTGADWRLVYLDVDAADADCHGGEGVLLDGEPVGITTSGGYGHTVGKSLAFAYVSPAASANGTELTVDILDDHRRAVVIDGPAYDPDNHELKG